MAVYGGYLDQIKRLGAEDWPVTRWLVDPADYAKPIVYETDDPQWSNPAKEPAIRQYCESGHHDHDGH
jgi:hypothetical protein